MSTLFHVGFSRSDSLTIFRSIDKDGNGAIDMEEFLDWVSGSALDGGKLPYH